MRMAPLFPSAALVALVASCGAAVGDSCRIDSDCEGGLICLASTCQTSTAVSDRFAPLSEDAVTPTPGPDTAAPSDDVTVTETPATHPCGDQPYMRTLLHCQEPRGAFTPGTGECLEPTAKYPVRSITMHAEASFVKMASLANPVLKGGIESGATAVSLWQDGDLALNCQGDQIWMRTDADRKADCSGEFGPGEFPLTIPISNPPLFIVVHDAEFDLSTGRLTGIVDREKLIADLPEAIRETGANLVTADVDTDGDGTPEDAFVALTVCF